MKHVFSILFLCLIFQMSVLTTKKSIKIWMAKVALALKLITDAKEKKLRKLQNTDVVTTDTEAGAYSSNATVSSLETDISSTQPSASETSSTQPSTSRTSAAQTSASKTSSADTNSNETSAAQTTGAQIPDTSVATIAPNETYVDNASESANATASNAEVPVTKPVAAKPISTTNTEAKVQVTKFHSFKKPTTCGPGKVTFGTFFYFFGRPIVKFIVVRLRIILVEDLEIYKKQLLNLPELIVK